MRRDRSQGGHTIHALIRHHFQNKEELWKEAVTFLFDRMYAELAVEPGSEDHLSNFEKTEKNRNPSLGRLLRAPP